MKEIIQYEINYENGLNISQIPIIELKNCTISFYSKHSCAKIIIDREFLEKDIKLRKCIKEQRYKMCGEFEDREKWEYRYKSSLHCKDIESCELYIKLANLKRKDGTKFYGEMDRYSGRCINPEIFEIIDDKKVMLDKVKKGDIVNIKIRPYEVINYNVSRNSYIKNTYELRYNLLEIEVIKKRVGSGFLLL